MTPETLEEKVQTSFVARVRRMSEAEGKVTLEESSCRDPETSSVLSAEK